MNDLDKLSLIYEQTVIQETPDSIQVDGKFISYDSPNANNIAAVIDENGGFVATTDIDGHYAMGSHVYAVEDLEELEMWGTMKTNAKDVSGMQRIYTKGIKVRLWKDHKILSFWDSTIPDYYNEGIGNFLKAYGVSPKSIDYDLMNYEGDYIPYAEFIKRDVNQTKLAAQQRQKKIDARKVAEYQAGISRDRNIPEWQRTEGG